MTNRFLSCIEKIHTYFNKTKHPDVDTEKQILYRSMKLTEEVGEFNEQLFTYLGKGKKEKLDKFDKDELAKEFADVVFAACLVARSCDVDIERALRDKMKILEERFGV